MSEPRTEAGRALVASHAGFSNRVLAIEAEATAAGRIEGRAQGVDIGRADALREAAERVRALAPHLMSPVGNPLLSLSDVLAAFDTALERP